MKQKPLLWGVDQLVLKQEVTPTPAAKILYNVSSLGTRLKEHGLALRGWRADEGKTKLRFEHLDLNFWRCFGKIHLEVWPSSESLTLAPRAAWEHAHGLYEALGLILGFEARPLVMSFDLFVDVAHLWVSKSLIGRIKNMHGLRCWSDPSLGGNSVIYGKPKRIRLYDKLLETREKPSKRFVQDAWREAGWDGAAPVCRIDMRFKMTTKVRARPLDLGALRDDALSRIVLTRRRRVSGRRATVRMEDPLWKTIRSLQFTDPWDAPPALLPPPCRSLNRDARQASSGALWSLASLLVIDQSRPDLLDPWAREVAGVVRRSVALRTEAFTEKLAARAATHDLPVPPPPPRLQRSISTPHVHDDPGLAMGTIEAGLRIWRGRSSARGQGYYPGPLVGHVRHPASSGPSVRRGASAQVLV